ncbi:ExeM/NucH family extracellular endonuclease [Parathalassolituus penaei]|uniref:ExeM/NucH family extracellular endonuclease n=1 Tax=Parathalassolituus penaei TaxID=2997323 RepID=A0A9X3ECZ4_9GAMM|nr:ExeM/NucH family extracellular endonuclease [Parathalassolituus penaei]MCY0964886.1 ExeM/NucH family extracellular endonuclease [Parathalassolituus penaei]
MLFKTPLLMTSLLWLLTATVNAQPLISEVDADTNGEDRAEFIELSGQAGESLDGWWLVLFNGNNGQPYRIVDLAGQKLDKQGLWLLCGKSAGLKCGQTLADGFLQNGPDAVALYQSKTPLRQFDKPSTSGLVDALLYRSGKTGGDALQPLLAKGQNWLDEAGAGNSSRDSLQRCGVAARSSDSFKPGLPTPGQANRCDGTAGSTDTGSRESGKPESSKPVSGKSGSNETASTSAQCGDNKGLTLISAVQGEIRKAELGDSPLSGQKVTVEAIVTYSAQGTRLPDGSESRQYRGYWLQEEKADEDGNPMTSEGIFVFDDKAGIAVGDKVCLTGLVSEFRGTTQLSKVTNRQICAHNQPLPPAASLSLPVSSLLQLEALEGMRVTISKPLLVSDFFGSNYSFANQGQLVLSSQLHYQPAESMAPGSAQARKLVADMALDRILLDDGSTDTYPAYIPFPDARGFAADRPVRIGDSVTRLTALVHASNDWYQLVPIDYQFAQTNPRPAKPPVAATANVRIASMNVLNYFNGDGKGGGFPTERGARSQAGFEMQSAKIVAALKGLDADVVALMELENDGFGPQSAMARLLSEVNRGLPADRQYKAVEVETSKRAAIRSGLLYRPARVSLIGDAAVLDSSSSPTDARGKLFDSGKHRPVLAQAVRIEGETLLLAVAHFKSKGSPCGEPNEGADGQGNCNQTRLRGAKGVSRFLQDQASARGINKVMLLGDLNAYRMEDPVKALVSGGLVDLKHSAAATEEHPWTYIHAGMLGSLDHALASPELAALVVSAGAWHINAAESDLMGYETEANGQDYPSIDHYASPDAWRSSDHDPVIVGLRIGKR